MNRKTISASEERSRKTGRCQALTHLLQSYRALDEDRELAWQHFHASYAGVVRAFAVRCGMTGEDVADCEQEVWTEMVRRLPSFCLDPRRGQFDSWLFRIVRGKAVNLCRARKRRVRQEMGDRLAESIDKHPEPAQAFEEHETVCLAWKQLARTLSACSFRVFEMRLLEDRTVDEVAETLGLKTEQVWYRYHRARRLLESMRTSLTGCGGVGAVVQLEDKEAKKSAQGIGHSAVSPTIEVSSLDRTGGHGVDYVFQRVELGRRESGPEWKVEWNGGATPKPTLHIRKCAVVAYAELCGPTDVFTSLWPRIVSAAVAAGVAAGIATIIATPTAAMPVFQSEFHRQMQIKPGGDEDRIQVALSARQEANGPWFECKG